MSKRKIVSPSREQLQALLVSDPATDAFIGDAKSIMAEHERDADDAAYSYICEVLGIVSSEIDPTYSGMLEGDGEQEDLEAIVVGAKRAALLLLCAAHEAEKRLAALKRPKASPKKRKRKPATGNLFEP